MRIARTSEVAYTLSPEEVAGIKQVLENISECLMTLDDAEKNEMRQLVGDIGYAIKNLATFLDNKSKEENDKYRVGWKQNKLS